MRDVFPGGLLLMDDTCLPADMRPQPAEHAAWVREQLAKLQPGDDGIIRARRPRPTAAFSPQDTTHPAYAEIKARAKARGFEPIERGTGGRLTVFDENALAIALIWPHPAPHTHTMLRYRVFAGAIETALQSLGLDAHIGELPNEYCPGKFSIHADGRVKLVGIAQRMNRRCFQLGAIVAVERSEWACAAIAEAYDGMGLPFDPATYGAVRDLKPQLAAPDICGAILASVVAAVQ